MGIRKQQRADGVRYEVVVDFGIDPVTGKRRQRSKSFKTKKEAQTHERAWLTDIEKGTVVERTRQTMAELLRYWLDTYARPNVSAKTLDMYEHIIEHHIIPTLGAVATQKLTPDHLQAFYADKLAAGCGPRTVQLCHLRITQALKQAVRLGLLSRNVADFVTAPRAPAREMQTWDAVQARAFLEAASQSPYGPIWLLSLVTGMRRGELLGLRWQDVDIQRHTLSVRQTIGIVGGKLEIKPPKTKSSRRDVAIQDIVVAALREHRAAQNERRLALGALWEDHDLVFCAANGRPIHPENLVRDYNHWVIASGVPRIRIHDQRHTHVTLAIAAGANVGAVSKRVGHARTSITTDIYQHVLPEQHIDVADKVGALLFDGVAQARR